MTSKIEQIWDHRGLGCMVRFALGYRCGYVEVPPSHPLFEKRYIEPEYDSIDVHGGVTFADLGSALEEAPILTGWLVGFDCGHSGDLTDIEAVEDESLKQELMWWQALKAGAREAVFCKIPGLITLALRKETLWTLPMVVDETERLADQLADMMTKESP